MYHWFANYCYFHYHDLEHISTLKNVMVMPLYVALDMNNSFIHESEIHFSSVFSG